MTKSLETGEALSGREREIAGAYAGGSSYKEIARDLGIAPATVRAHLRAIYRKTGVSSKIALSSALTSGRANGQAGQGWPASPSKPSIAVLPFANLSGDPDQQCFVDGLAEDIVTELSRFHRLQVLSAESSARCRDAMSAPGRGGGPGVHYLLEGSVRRGGEGVRITTRLTDTATGAQLWSDRFDRDHVEIFSVQDQIVRRIVGTIAGRVEAASADRARRKLPASLEAYECVLRGKAIGYGDPDGEAEARRLFERAIETDPGYALAYSKLAHILSLEWVREQSESSATLDRAFELARRAVALDPDEPECQFTLGWIHLFRRSFDLAERYFRRALELNPNDPEQAANMGNLNSFLGNSEEALGWFRAARRLDPFYDPCSYWRVQGIAHFVANRLDEALANFAHSPVIPLWARVYMAACHALRGERELAAACRARILRESPGFSLARFAGKEPLRRAEDRDRLVEGMRRAGLPE